MSIDRIEEQRIWQDLHPKVKRGVLAIKEKTEIKDAAGNDASHLLELVVRTTGEQVRALKVIDDLTEHQKENGGFIFAFFKELNALNFRFPTLTKQDIARLMYIGTFIAWESNRLQSDNGRRHYNKKDLEKLTEMSTRRFNEFFKRLENENIIQESETGELFINPTVFYRGNLRNHQYDISDYNYTRLFKKTVRDLYAQFKGRTLAQLSVIYSVLPFLNFETNIVCFNPSETSEDLIKPMNLDELSKLLGYVDASSLKRTLNRIKVDNQPVFGFFENPHDRRKYRIVVNPRVVFAGNGESLKTVKVLFS